MLQRLVLLTQGLAVVSISWLFIVLLTLSGCQPERGERGPAGSNGSQGAQGSQGVTGPTGSPGTVIEVIDPCPLILAAYPEVLWRMDGDLYAVYAQGQKIHLVKLTPGNYQTTDGRACNFVVNADGTVQ